MNDGELPQSNNDDESEATSQSSDEDNDDDDSDYNNGDQGNTVSAEIEKIEEINNDTPTDEPRMVSELGSEL